MPSFVTLVFPQSPCFYLVYTELNVMVLITLIITFSWLIHHSFNPSECSLFQLTLSYIVHSPLTWQNCNTLWKSVWLMQGCWYTLPNSLVVDLPNWELKVKVFLWLFLVRDIFKIPKLHGFFSSKLLRVGMGFFWENEQGVFFLGKGQDLPSCIPKILLECTSEWFHYFNSPSHNKAK